MGDHLLGNGRVVDKPGTISRASGRPPQQPHHLLTSSSAALLTVRRVCPNCVPVEGIQDHFGTLRRNEVCSIIAYDISTFASLAIPRDRSENPGVGGSM